MRSIYVSEQGQRCRSLALNTIIASYCCPQDLLQTQQLTLAHQPSMPSGFYLQLKASLNHRAPPDYMPSGFFTPLSTGDRWVLESSPDACETPTFQSYQDAGMEGYRASFTMARSRTNAYVDSKLRLEQMKGGERLLFDVNTAFGQQSAPSDELGMSTLLGAGVSGGGSSDSVVSPCALIRADTRNEEPVPAHVLMEWEKKRPKDVCGEDMATVKPCKSRLCAIYRRFEIAHTLASSALAPQPRSSRLHVPGRSVPPLLRSMKSSRNMWTVGRYSLAKLRSVSEHHSLLPCRRLRLEHVKQQKHLHLRRHHRPSLCNATATSREATRISRPARIAATGSIWPATVTPMHSI